MGEALSKRIQQNRFESPSQEAVLNLFVAADYLREKLEAVCAQFNITPGQYNVLRILRGAYPNGHSRCEILQRTIERAPDITRLVDRLEVNGLVERDRSETDRRLSISRITKEGLDLIQQMEPAMQELHNHFANRVSLRDCRELSRICEGLYGDYE
jgi:DNA-binding MarR family transcriptional regulator